MKNWVKEKLKRNEPSLGAWVTIGHPDVTDILSHAGYDWLLIDTEHSPLDMETVQKMIQAMGNTETIPIVRVAWNDIVMIKRALDIGAYGVVIPWVNSKAEAVNAVTYCKYPPRGLRGVGPRKASTYGLDSEYLKTADEEILIIAQIETRRAIENVEEIVSVEGIDATFIGPSDLSTSMGFMGEPFHPKVLEAMDKVLRACAEADVAPGIAYTPSVEETLKFVEKGFRFIGVSSDMGLLLGGSKKVLGEIKRLR